MRKVQPTIWKPPKAQSHTQTPSPEPRIKIHWYTMEFIIALSTIIRIKYNSNHVVPQKLQQNMLVSGPDKEELNLDEYSGHVVVCMLHL